MQITDSELDVDGESQSLLLPDTNSKLTVSGILLGDTQDDKRVSVKDISNIIDYKFCFMSIFLFMFLGCFLTINSCLLPLELRIHICVY